MGKKREPTEAQLEALAKARKVLEKKRKKNKVNKSQKHYFGKKI